MSSAEAPSLSPLSQMETEGPTRADRRSRRNHNPVTDSDNQFRTGNERLYEAYNDLHSLAQDFQKPFDAPAILVVGHQTDGKSGEYSPRTVP